MELVPHPELLKRSRELNPGFHRGKLSRTFRLGFILVMVNVDFVHSSTLSSPFELSPAS